MSECVGHDSACAGLSPAEEQPGNHCFRTKAAKSSA